MTKYLYIAGSHHLVWLQLTHPVVDGPVAEALLKSGARRVEQAGDGLVVKVVRDLHETVTLVWTHGGSELNLEGPIFPDGDTPTNVILRAESLQYEYDVLCLVSGIRSQKLKPNLKPHTTVRPTLEGPIIAAERKHLGYGTL